jgi:hypothetical protein
MTTLQFAKELKNDFRNYYFPDTTGKTISLLQIEEKNEEFMRKSYKKLKPKPDKLKTPPKFAITDEEKKVSKEISKAANPKKAVMLPQGFSYDWQKEKEDIQKRKIKKELSL